MQRSRIVTGLVVLLTLIAGSLVSAGNLADAQEQSSQEKFARTTIDLGVVVSDVDAAVDFYTKAIGFKELPGFHVPADIATRTGLTDGQPLSIRVLVLEENETATKLKLMELPGVKSKPSDNETIHAQFGVSYLTINVTDMNAAVARLKKAGAKVLAEGPVELPASLAEGVYLAVVRDPDGNLVELVGPKKQ